MGGAISGPFSSVCVERVGGRGSSVGTSRVSQLQTCGLGGAWGGAPQQEEALGEGEGLCQGVWLMLAGACEGTSSPACFSQPRP